MVLTKPKSFNVEPSDGTGEDIAHSKRRYAALVRTCHERKAAEHLDRMGIKSFAPIQQEIHQWNDRHKVIELALPPMMVFVYVNPKKRKEVLGFPIVSHYMVMRGKSSLVVIPDEQMACLRSMLNYSEEAICMNSSPLARNEKVRVVRRPLTGLVGELVNVGGKSKIATRLNMLGRACVNMPTDYVEAAYGRN